MGCFFVRVHFHGFIPETEINLEYWKTDWLDKKILNPIVSFSGDFLSSDEPSFGDLL